MPEKDFLASLLPSEPIEFNVGDRGEGEVYSVTVLKDNSAILVNIKGAPAPQRYSVPEGIEIFRNVLATYKAKDGNDLKGKVVKYIVTGTYTNPATGEVRANISIISNSAYIVKSNVVKENEEPTI